jgi:hypothetical protein
VEIEQQPVDADDEHRAQQPEHDEQQLSLEHDAVVSTVDAAVARISPVSRFDDDDELGRARRIEHALLRPE